MMLVRSTILMPASAPAIVLSRVLESAETATERAHRHRSCAAAQHETFGCGSTNRARHRPPNRDSVKTMLISPLTRSVIKPLCNARRRCSQGANKGGGDAKQCRKKTARAEAGDRPGIQTLPHRRPDWIFVETRASACQFDLPDDHRRSQHHADAVLEYGEAQRVHRAVAESARPSRRHGQGDDAGRRAPVEGAPAGRFAA